MIYSASGILVCFSSSFKGYVQEHGSLLYCTDLKSQCHCHFMFFTIHIDRKYLLKRTFFRKYIADVRYKYLDGSDLKQATSFNLSCDMWL